MLAGKGTMKKKIMFMSVSCLLSTVLLAVEDPKPLPRLEDVLASVQERVARQLEARKAQEAAALSTEGNSARQQESPVNSNLGLKQAEHVKTASLEERIDRLLAAKKNQNTVSSPVSELMTQARTRVQAAGMQSQGQVFNKSKEVQGSLKIDGDVDDVPQFKIYFDGMETTNNAEGFFKFPTEPDVMQNYGIIICNKIKHTFGRHNTVDSFGLIPDMNYKYFRYKKQADGRTEWVLQEKDLTKKSLQVPQNTIVFTINPAYFDHLETEWPGKFGSDVVKLPRIVLKAGHRKKIARKAMKSLLWGLDMSPFHTPVKHVSKDIENGRGEASVDFAG